MTSEEKIRETVVYQEGFDEGVKSEDRRLYEMARKQLDNATDILRKNLEGKPYCTGYFKATADMIVALFGTEKHLTPKESVKEEDEFIPFDKLAEHGIKPGDIVINKSGDSFLLRDGFPDDFNTALCCNKLLNGSFHLSQIGFQWVGSTNGIKYRKATDEEREKFKEACIVSLNGRIYEESIWKEQEYAQILHSMFQWNLIDKEEHDALNKKLKIRLGVDLKKLYKEVYG